MQPLIDKAQVEANPDTRKQMYADIQQWAQDTAYTIPLYYGANNWGVAAKVQNLWVDPVMGLRLQEAWIKK